MVSVNSKRINVKSVGMQHFEGGYKEDADPKKIFSDVMEASKYKRKKANENDAKEYINYLINDVHRKNIVRHNSILDFFETYFDNDNFTALKDDMQTKVTTLLKDPYKRTVSALDFPSDERKLASAHSCLKFQSPDQSSSTEGYIWNLENPNYPETILKSPSPIVSLNFNPKNSTELLGGLYNGQIVLWDTKERKP